MTKRKTGYGFGSRRRAMIVESLEQRAMLAGNVSVSLSGGNLLVQGDKNDNIVLIEQVGDGQYAVTGFDAAVSGLSGFKAGPTRINGTANGTVVIAGVTGDVNVQLRQGNDIVGIGNSVDDLASLAEEAGIGFGIGEGSGNGSEQATLQQQVDGRFFVPRNLIINTAEGNDGVVVNADVEGFATINTGAGNDAVVFGNVSSSESDVGIGGGLNILTGPGSDAAAVQFVTLYGQLNVQTGDHVDNVSLTEFDAGSVLVLTGNGNDFATLNAFETDYGVTVNTAAGNDAAFLSDFSAGQGAGPTEQTGGGYVSVVTGAGNDNAELVFFEADGVTVNTGDGHDGTPSNDSPITVEQALITNDLTILTGAGNDLAVVEFVEARNVYIDTGIGNDGTVAFPIEVYNVLVQNLTVHTRAGNDNVYVHAGDGEEASSVNGNLLVTTEAGNDIVQVIEQQIANDLTVNLGVGNDQAAIGLDDEIGDGSVETGMTVRRNVSLDAGGGNDLVGIGEIEILNDIYASLGAGNDVLFAFLANIGGNATIDAGAGNDVVSFSDSFVNGNMTIRMGAGNDILGIFGSNGNGTLKVYGGAGRDEFDNDLGISGNGTFEDGIVEVREFELFETEEEPG